jgi:PKD repeat protein
MKRLLLFVIVSTMLSISIMAQKNWVGFTSDIPGTPKVFVEQQDQSKVVLDISVAGMYVAEFTQAGRTFQRLELTEDRTTKDIGKPELPMISELLGIPGNQMIRVNILEKETIKLENYLVYPFQTPTTDNPGGQNKEFVMDQKFYSQPNSYPFNQVYLDQPSMWRDMKIAGLHIFPFSYNTSSMEIEVITHLRLEVEFYGTNPDFNFSPDKLVSPNFYKMYQASILNFQSLGYSLNPKSNDDIKYLIITNTEALSSIQPLVDWKNQQGFRVEVKTLQSGFNTPQNFKDYITQLYDNDDLEYILMVGDAYPNGGNPPGTNDVPMFYWAPSGEDASYSDSWYTCMNGPDDHYADIAIGRIVYDNLGELDLQIQKTIDHYFNPDATTNWAENTILIAHQEEYPGKYTQCCEEIRTFPYSLQTPIFQQAYGGAGYTNAQVVNYVNTNSCGIFNYRGHGSALELWEWGPSGSFTAQHVNQLTNEDRLFVFFDVCCDNMDIVAHAGNCLCESFMKSPVASVAVNGAIIPSYTIPNHDYDKEMYKAVFEEGIYNIGYVTNFANITVLTVHGDLGRSNVRTYLWLGDASLEPWTLQPANITATHDAQLFLGLSNFTVNVIGTGSPLQNAMVCVSNEDQTVYGVAYTDANGDAEILFDGPVQNPGTAKVTVTAHNYIPYQADIPVIPQSGPYVVKDSFSLNDLAGGNGDGLMDYGESILLSLAVKNVGIAQATNVNVTLSTSDPYITFTDNTHSYGNIGPDQVIMATDAFAFNVANDIPDGHYVLINVEANGGSDDIWTSNLIIGGHAPVLELGEVIISDPAGNNNGKIDPGETVNLLITAENSGSSEAFNLVGEISEMDPFLTINSAQVNYGDILGGANASGIFSVTAASNTPAGHTVEITFDLSADMGITGTGNFDVVIGQVPVLIIDLDGNGNSAPQMEAALDNMDISFESMTSFPADLNLYSSVFVCLGIYTSNHVLSSAEGQSLADYLNNGGSLYMEGGDTWAYDAATAVHSMFNIDGSSDGNGDMGTVAGKAGTFVDGLSFSYNGDNNYMDHIEPIGSAVKIFENQSPLYGTGVAYDGGTYRTIGTSHEFGGLVDGVAPSTKEELMTRYLDFLGISQTLQALFVSSTTETCTQEIINFYDQSSGGAISWEWTFEGGTPGSSTNQNPVVAYFSPGTFDVTLTISDGVETSTLVMENYMTVIADPQIPGAPTGEVEICTNWSEPTQYSTSGANNAESYIWEILPAEAGTISGNDLIATVSWELNWEGTATIKVKGYNESCGEGLFSTSLDVVCSICTGINEHADLADIQIYPNPSNGRITVSFDSNVGMTEISVMNMLNKLVFSDKTETTTGKNLNIDLSNFSKGVYFIKLKTDRQEVTRKIVIQ